jgi:hypothetical protein
VSASGTLASDPRVIEIVRDIARGGLAGLVTGFLVAGVGGRIAMRIAALLVPTAAGLPTENGNRIGEITLGGTIALIVFVGLFAALTFGVTWVVLSPWLPRSPVVRGLVAMPVAVALGAFALIDGENPDFLTLDHDPAVVAVLIALVALVPLIASLADAALDRRLPHPTSIESGAFRVYVGLALFGGLFGAVLFIQASTTGPSQPLALSVILLGIPTLLWWRQRWTGSVSPSRELVFSAWAIIVIGTVAGFAVVMPEIRAALGLG